MDPIKTGKIISERRIALELTQRQLADKVGVTSQAVSKWERGLSFPDITVLLPLSEILDVSLTDLLKGEIMETNNELKDEVLASTIDYYARETKQVRRRDFIKWVIVGVIIIAMIVGMLFVETKRTIDAEVARILDGIDNQSVELFLEDDDV